MRTDDPDPSYLRIAVLNRFTDNEWSSGDRDVPEQPDRRRLDARPRRCLRRADPRTSTTTSSRPTRDFRSTWLPTHSLVSQVEAPGDWRYDVSTMDFLASNDDLDTSQLDVDAGGDQGRLRRQPAGGSATGRRAGLPRLHRPAHRARPDGADSSPSRSPPTEPTRYEKAVALQQWFRENGEFSYDDRSTSATAPTTSCGSSARATDGRTGYCEQFAAAMAVMARELGIPARVAVGFLEPDQVDDDEWVYSAHDLHAWPELFFSGSGWVRFEPTPPGRASGVPDYTDQAGHRRRHDGHAVGDRHAERTCPRASRTRPCRGGPRRGPGRQDQSDGGGFPWVWVAGALRCSWSCCLVVARPADAAPATPRPARTRSAPRRPGRSCGTPRSTCGCPGRSTARPGRPARRWSQLFGAPRDEFTPERPRRGPETNPDAVFALDRIVHSLERLRYARADGSEPGTWRAEMQTCVEALYGGAPQARPPGRGLVATLGVRAPRRRPPPAGWRSRGRARHGRPRRRPRRLMATCEERAVGSASSVVEQRRATELARSRPAVETSCSPGWERTRCPTGCRSAQLRWLVAVNAGLCSFLAQS